MRILEEGFDMIETKKYINKLSAFHALKLTTEDKNAHIRIANMQERSQLLNESIKNLEAVAASVKYIDSGLNEKFKQKKMTDALMKLNTVIENKLEYVDRGLFFSFRRWKIIWLESNLRKVNHKINNYEKVHFTNGFAVIAKALNKNLLESFKTMKFHKFEYPRLERIRAHKEKFTLALEILNNIFLRKHDTLILINNRPGFTIKIKRYVFGTLRRYANSDYGLNQHNRISDQVLAFHLLIGWMRKRISRVLLETMSHVKEKVYTSGLAKKKAKQIISDKAVIIFSLLDRKLKGLTLEAFLFIRNCSLFIKNKLKGNALTDFKEKSKMFSITLLEQMACKKQEIRFSAIIFLRTLLNKTKAKKLIAKKLVGRLGSLYFNKIISLKHEVFLRLKLVDYAHSLADSSTERKECSYTSAELGEINNSIIGNQAVVNYELERLNMKKSEKLSKILAKTRLFKALMNEMERLQKKKEFFFSKWAINITFEPKRFMEFQHYLVIQQEERNILQQELEQLSEQRDFATEDNEIIDPKEEEQSFREFNEGDMEQEGGLYLTERNNKILSTFDQSDISQKKLEFEIQVCSPRSSKFKEDIDENYIDSLETANMALKDFITRNEEELRNEEEFYANELRNLELKIEELAKQKMKKDGDKPVFHPRNKAKTLLTKSIPSYNEEN